MNVFQLHKSEKPTLWVPIGPSGSGKSTLFQQMFVQNQSLRSFSWDSLRLEWYNPHDYEKAWNASIRDKGFEKRAQNVFNTLLDEGVDVFLDNVNLKSGRRAWFLEQAKAKGYRTVAVVFPKVTIDTLMERQKSRTDKSVPVKSVMNQFQNMESPKPGEFNNVVDA